MRQTILRLVLVCALGVAAGGALAGEDTRTGIKVDALVKADVLKEMRELTERLDDVLAALAEGDFHEVTSIAEIHLGYGHKKLEAMVAAGASEADIQARRKRMKANRAAREAAGTLAKSRGMSLFGLPAGIGAKLPEDFWSMGQSMHAAGEELGAAARSIAEKDLPATTEDYRTVLSHLQEMTAACRNCHNAFKLD